MALTSRFIVLFLCPLVFDIQAAMTGGSVLDWRPDDGTRIALVPRDGSPVRWISDAAFWVWHFANAFDAEPQAGQSAGDVVVDYVEWSYPGGFAREDAPPTGRLVRATIDPEKRTVVRDVRAEHEIEFPRIDDRLLTTSHRWISTVGKAADGAVGFDALRFFDMDSGSDHIMASAGMAYGEPIFLPGSDGGYWGAFTIDRSDDSSWFVIVAADDLDSGPIARIEMPHRVPSGLHGAWLPAS